MKEKQNFFLTIKIILLIKLTYYRKDYFLHIVKMFNIFDRGNFTVV